LYIWVIMPLSFSPFSVFRNRYQASRMMAEYRPASSELK